MFGPGYVWVVFGPLLYNGLVIADAESPDVMGCTKEQLVEASSGFFVLNYYVISQTDTPTVSGQVVVVS